MHLNTSNRGSVFCSLFCLIFLILTTWLPGPIQFCLYWFELVRVDNFFFQKTRPNPTRPELCTSLILSLLKIQSKGEPISVLRYMMMDEYGNGPCIWIMTSTHCNKPKKLNSPFQIHGQNGQFKTMKYFCYVKIIFYIRILVSLLSLFFIKILVSLNIFK